MVCAARDACIGVPDRTGKLAGGDQRTLKWWTGGCMKSSKQKNKDKYKWRDERLTISVVQLTTLEELTTKKVASFPI
jgi:hypothetical protein